MRKIIAIIGVLLVAGVALGLRIGAGPLDGTEVAVTGCAGDGDYGVVTVTNVATLVPTGSANCCWLQLQNDSSNNDVYIGFDNLVTTTTGTVLHKDGGVQTMQPGDDCGNIYLIRPAGPDPPIRFLFK